METKPLTDLVKIAKSAVADSPLDAVRTIKIKTTNTTTNLQWTDLTTYVRVNVPSGKQTPGETAVDATKLAKLLGLATTTVVELEIDTALKLTAGDQKIKLPSAVAIADLPAWPAEFKPADKGELHLDPDRLDYLLLAVSSDLTRENLTHVFFDSTGLASTDAHRMHFVKCDGPKEAFALPASAVEQLTALLRVAALLKLYQQTAALTYSASKPENNSLFVEIRFDSHQFSFTIATMAKTGNTFPDCTQVIAEAIKAKLSFSFDLDAKIVKKISAAATTLEAKGVLIATENDQISWTVSDADGSSATGTLRGSLVENAKVQVNPKYLKDAIDGAIASVDVRTDMDPVTVHVGNDRTAVVMPIRL